MEHTKKLLFEVDTQVSNLMNTLHLLKWTAAMGWMEFAKDIDHHTPPWMSNMSYSSSSTANLHEHTVLLFMN